MTKNLGVNYMVAQKNVIFCIEDFKSYKSEKQISFVNQCSINLFISFFAGLNVGGRNEVHLNVSKFISSPNLFEIVFNLPLK